ncbi:MAG: hypothetical protein ACRC3G_04680 [Bacteroidales bacterium]
MSWKIFLIEFCITDNAETIDTEIAQPIFSIQASEEPNLCIPDKTNKALEQVLFSETQNVISENTHRNTDFFDVEMDKLDQWADDMRCIKTKTA